MKTHRYTMTTAPPDACLIFMNNNEPPPPTPDIFLHCWTENLSQIGSTKLGDNLLCQGGKNGGSRGEKKARGGRERDKKGRSGIIASSNFARICQSAPRVDGAMGSLWSRDSEEDEKAQSVKRRTRRRKRRRGRV